MIEIKTAGLDEYLDGGKGKYRVLMFGTPGSGKTPWAAQFPKPFFIMADRGGASSLVLTKTPYAEALSEKAMHEIIDHLYKDSLKKEPLYETVVLDTFSVAQKHVLQEMLKVNGKDNPDDFREWGALTAKMSKVLHRLQALDKHIIVNVHIKDKFNSETGEMEPALTGGMKDELPREFPFIGWMHSSWEVQQVDGQDQRVTVRKVAWQATPKMPFLRSASNILPAETDVTFTPADFQQIEDAIRGGAGAIDIKAGVIGAIESVQTEVETLAAPATAPSGPVEVKAEKLPKPSAATRAKAASALPKAAAPVDGLDAAVAIVQDVLGAEVIETFDLVEAIKAVTIAAEFTTLWQQNKADWLPEHSELVKARKAALSA